MKFAWVGGVVLILAITCFHFLPISTVRKESMSLTRDLLPTNVVPSRYSITLSPSFTTFKAKGREVIDISVKEATTQIQVHSKEITIQSVEFVSSGLTISSKYHGLTSKIN